jgi:hypothetical protein
MQQVEAKFKDAKIDWLDGITVTYPTWWVNVRPSNTEPFLRMCLEADTQALMEQSAASCSRSSGTLSTTRGRRWRPPGRARLRPKRPRGDHCAGCT